MKPLLIISWVSRGRDQLISVKMPYSSRKTRRMRNHFLVQSFPSFTLVVLLKDVYPG